MFKNRLMALCLTVVLCCSMLIGCNSSSNESSNEKVKVLTYAHAVSEDSNSHRMGLKFKEEVQRLSEGKMDIKVLANFAGEREMLESVQRGDLDFTFTSAAPVVNFEPRFAVFDVPFLFESKDNLNDTIKSVFNVFDQPEIKEILGYLEENSIKGLGFWGKGFRVLATNKEINTLEDLKGIKLRTMENKNHIATWKALGANPTPMSFSEVYTAIEQGTIEGQEQPFDILDSYKFYEVLDYATSVNMIFDTCVFMMSTSVYEGLTAEEQKIIDEAAEIAIEFARQDALENVNKNIANMEDHGMIVNDLSEEERARAIESTKEIEKSIRKEIGDEIVDRFKNLQ